MTDTRVTVDVSTEALLQRARQQQAQGRQAAIQREEERKGVERQKREARKAGRNQPPGQDRLKGRSKLRGMAPRHEVAAGYVQQYVLAGAFVQSVNFHQDYNEADPDSTTSYEVWKIHSGNQNASVEFKYNYLPRSQFGNKTLERAWYALPAGGRSMVLVTMPQIYRSEQGWLNSSAIYSFYITGETVRKIPTPSGLNVKILESVSPGSLFDYNPVSLYDEVILEKAKGWPSNQLVDQSTFWLGPRRAGADLDTLQKINGIPQTAPPGYLVFYTKRISRTITAKIYRSLPITGSGIAAPWAAGAGRLASEEIYSFYTGTADGTLTWNPNEYPQFGSYRLVAWDWGKPDLCRRLLLQLGFRSEDLRP